MKHDALDSTSSSTAASGSRVNQMVEGVDRSCDKFISRWTSHTHRVSEFQHRHLFPCENPVFNERKRETSETGLSGTHFRETLLNFASFLRRRKFKYVFICNSVISSLKSISNSSNSSRIVRVKGWNPNDGKPWTISCGTHLPSEINGHFNETTSVPLGAKIDRSFSSHVRQQEQGLMERS